MPLLDVTDVLFDPMFAANPGAVQLIRSTQTVNNYGETVLTTVTTDISTLPWTAVVVPADGDTLDLLPDTERAGGVIEVYTNFVVNVATDTTAPDLIAWEGKQWTVRLVHDYRQFGQGYTCAICVLRSFEAPT